MQTIGNVRFWTFLNGSPVRLKMTPGQSLEWGNSYRTDEGWASEFERWEYDGFEVTCESETDGCDCDGRLSRHYETVALVSDLAAGSADMDDPLVVFPVWQRVSSGQRDYSAEAMGY